MLDAITRANAWLNALVWGPPMLVLLMGTGLLLTIVTGAVQFRHLGTALGEVLGKLRRPATGDGSVTPFQAVATALASTVGVGNIAGVATAIMLGGPGALFWLWVSGLLGMGTKFAEITIALHYRERDASGTMRGGAMYTLRRLGLPWLGGIFAAVTLITAQGDVLSCVNDVAGRSRLANVRELTWDEVLAWKRTTIAGERWFPACTACDDGYRWVLLHERGLRR